MDCRKIFKNPVLAATAFLLAAAAGTALYLTMDKGAGVSTDSVVFLDTAENIVDKGKIWTTAYGRNIPMTHFPPLYPTLLATLSRVSGASIETSAKILGALAFALNALLCGALTRRFGASAKTAFIAAALLALSEAMISIHAKVLTEPLFITFLLAALCALPRFLETGKWRWLATAAVLTALSCLQRYAGLALVAAGTLSLLLLPRARLSIKRRLARAAAFSAMASAPLALWMLRNMIIGGSAANRHLVFHPIDLPHVRQLVRSILFVFLPNPAIDWLKNAGTAPKLTLAALSLVVTAGFAALLWRHRRRVAETVDGIFSGESAAAATAALVFLAVYPAFLATSISFADYSTPLSYRVMLPEFAVAIPFCAWLAAEVAARNGKSAETAVAAIAATLLISYALRSTALCAEIHSKGLEYSSDEWRKSPLVEFLRGLPSDAPVYTNGAAGIYYQTKRTTKPIPRETIDGAQNPEYESEMAAMAVDIRKNRGAVLYFNNVPSSLLPTPAELTEKLELETVLSGDNGTVLAPNGD